MLENLFLVLAMVACWSIYILVITKFEAMSTVQVWLRWESRELFKRDMYQSIHHITWRYRHGSVDTWQKELPLKVHMGTL